MPNTVTITERWSRPTPEYPRGQHAMKIGDGDWEDVPTAPEPPFCELVVVEAKE